MPLASLCSGSCSTHPRLFSTHQPVPSNSVKSNSKSYNFSAQNAPTAPLAIQSECQSLRGFTRSAHCPLPWQFTLYSPLSLFLKHTRHTQRGLCTYSQYLEHCSQIASSIAHFITCFRALLTYHLNGEAFPDLYMKLNAPQYTLPCSFSALFFAVLTI